MTSALVESPSWRRRMKRGAAAVRSASCFAHGRAGRNGAEIQSLGPSGRRARRDEESRSQSRGVKGARLGLAAMRTSAVALREHTAVTPGVLRVVTPPGRCLPAFPSTRLLDVGLEAGCALVERVGLAATRRRKREPQSLFWQATGMPKPAVRTIAHRRSPEQQGRRRRG